MSTDSSEIIAERGEYRAVIDYDPSPDAPDNEYGNPVLRVEPSGYGGGLVTATGYGSVSAKGDGIKSGAIDALQQFVSNHGWSDGIDTFGRWLRIWHGGDATRYSGRGWDDPTYVAYSTRKMAIDGWGHTDETLAAHPEYLVPELDEWQAYCEGEVYLAWVERRLLKRTEYVTLDDYYPVEADEREVWFDVEDTVVGGHYGEKWAREAALEALDPYVKDTDYRCSDEGIFHDLQDWECKHCAFVVEPEDRTVTA
jgi:hypothetical protein